MVRSVLLAILLSQSSGGKTYHLPDFEAMQKQIAIQIRKELLKRTRKNPDQYLAFAIQSCDEATAKAALDNGADPNLRKYFGSLPFINAPNGKEIKIAKLLVERGADVNFQASPNDYTALSEIAKTQFSNPELGEFLIQQGADFDKPGFMNRTPLREAVEAGKLSFVKMLLSHGADPNANAYWPSKYATYPCWRELEPVEAFHEAENNSRQWRPAINPVIFGLAEHWDPDIASLLVKHGANLHECDEHGWSVLHFAAFKGNLDAIQGLVSLGFDVNEPTAHGFTPLHCALRNSYHDKILGTIDLLLKLGANPMVGDDHGHTPEDLLRSDSIPLLRAYKEFPQSTWSEELFNENLNRINSLLSVLHTKSNLVRESDFSNNPSQLRPLQFYAAHLTRNPELDGPVRSNPYAGQKVLPLVRATRNISISSGKAILSLNLELVHCDSATIQFNEIHLNHWETASSIPVILKLQKGHTKTIQFEFPEIAGNTSGVYVQYELSNIQQLDAGYETRNETRLDETEESPEMDLDFNTAGYPRFYENPDKTRSLEIKFEKFVGENKLHQDLVGRTISIGPREKFWIPNGKDISAYDIVFQYRLLPNQRWIRSTEKVTSSSGPIR